MNESRIAYIPINTQVKTSTPFKVQITELELQDYNEIMLDDWTLIFKDYLFHLHISESRPYERNDNVLA